MRVVPKKVVQRIEFFGARVEKLEANAGQIGITPEEAADLAGKVAAARAALVEQAVAEHAARNATARLRHALDAMSTAGAAVILKVRATAKAGGGDAVFPLAGIPAPAAPSRVGKPGTPYDLARQLHDSGALELTWKADHPRGCDGVIYQIARRIDAAPGGEFKHLAACGTRRFTDWTVPAGAGRVTYRIRATRSTAAGDAAEFTVNLGVRPGSVHPAIMRPSQGDPMTVAA